MKYLIAFVWMLFFSAANAQDEDYVSLQDRLKSNIFLKVEASNTDCFVGEPIIVTYKLYSALATESSIVKNPYFDGFDVKDLKGSSDNIASRETVDGVRFDVHTLLKLQLTPRKAGRLRLGALTVQNRIRLVDARGNEDPLLAGVEEGYTLNNGYFTLPVSSVPITILVTALPGTSPSTQSTQPNGIVGDFKMDVQLSKELLAPGERAQLTIMLTGRGDFSKIELPEIDWPEAADVLAAKVDEDKAQKQDGGGYKSFTIPFTINAPGKYTIPSIRFSFFDAQGGRYKTITNIPVELNVVSEGSIAANEPSTPIQDKDFPMIGIGLAVLAMAIIFTLVVLYKKRKQPARQVTAKPVKEDTSKNTAPASLSVSEALRAAEEHINKEDSSFGASLKEGMLRYIESRWKASLHPYNPELMQQLFIQKATPVTIQSDFSELMAAIDMNIYSGGETETDRQYLLHKAKSLLQKF